MENFRAGRKKGQALRQHVHIAVINGDMDDGFWFSPEPSGQQLGQHERFGAGGNAA